MLIRKRRGRFVVFRLKQGVRFSSSAFVLLVCCFCYVGNFAVPLSSFYSSLSLLSATLITPAMAEEIVPQVTRRSEDGLPDIRDDVDWRAMAPVSNKAQKADKEKVSVRSPEHRRPVVESFSGVDGTENQVGFYSGGVTGALGPHLSLKGLKLRAVYGRGYYQYTSSRNVGGTYVDIDFMGRSEFYEAMVGYEFRLSSIIFKAYAGLISETNHIDPADIENSLEGSEYGAKFLLESWREFDSGHWVSAYGAYSTGSEYYVVHGRYGVPFNAHFDFGLEAGVFGNQEFDALRFGGFSRYKFSNGEMSFSAGVSGDYDQPDAFYGTLQYYTKINRLGDLLGFDLNP